MKILQDVYERLFAAYGPQHWWPGDSPFEVIVGAMLTQNTSWKNVERAIDNLKQADVLDATRMHEMPTEELAELIRPAGYYRIKTARLKNLLALIANLHDGRVENLLATSKTELREQLLAVNGIGPETADAIVLYASQQPIFVVDTYTARVLTRHGWINEEADYHQIQEYFHLELPENVDLFNEYHALLVKVGKQHCGRKPECEECPLCELLPSGGPLLPEANNPS